MREQLRVGIVGMGGIGMTHARALLQVEGVRLSAWSGGHPENGRAFGWPAASHTTPGALIADADVDVVVLCSPTEVHGRQAITVARSGRHVVVEKPMTMSVAEADELVALQLRGPGIVSMVSQRRFEPVYSAVKQMLLRGELGEVRLAMAHVPWFRDAPYFDASPWRASAAGGGSLVNQGVHSVDLLQWLCGPVQSVTAQSTTQVSAREAEDTMVSTIRFTSGALGTVVTSTATPPGFPASLTIHTSLGRIELGQGDILSWEIPGVPPPEQGSTIPGGSSDPAAIGLVGHVAVWEDVVEAVRSHRWPLVDAVEGAAVTRVLCAIRESARTGQETTLADLV